MGNLSSKLEESTEGNKITSDSAPALATPVRYLELDPRSPSCNIARTPIEILNQEVLENTTFTDHEEKNKCNKIIDTDPRSPTTEFIRTPIVVETNPNYEINLRNKALNNLKKQLGHSEPKRSVMHKTKRYNSSINLKTDLEINVNYEGKNKEFKRPYSTTSLQQNKIGETDCNSIPGLLETNLDDVLCPPVDIIALTCSPVKVKQSKNLDKNVLDEEIQTNNKGENISLQSLQSKLKAVEAKDNFNILHIPVNEESKNKNEIYSNNSPEMRFKSKHEKLLKTPKNDNMVPKTPYLLSKEIEYPRKSLNFISPSVVEFDKKLTHLIYEDAQDGINQINIKENCRTPLSTRNCNEIPTKPKLKVSDKPTKLNSGSKIPVLREKKLKEKQLRLQCENTPPKSMELFKTKVTNWDADHTLII